MHSIPHSYHLNHIFNFLLMLPEVSSVVNWKANILQIPIWELQEKENENMTLGLAKWGYIKRIES